MKNVFFIIAILFLFKPIIPIIDYAINYKYISTTLCENKNKPERHCNGKCHLAKEITKTTNSENSSSNKTKIVTDIEVLYCQEFKEKHLFKSFFLTKSIKIYHYENLYFHLSSSGWFHPPC